MLLEESLAREPPYRALVPNSHVALSADTRVSHLSMGTLSTLIVDAVTSGTKSIKDAVDLGFDNIRSDLDRVESAQKQMKDQVQEVQENNQKIEKSVCDQGALLEELRSRVSKLEVVPKVPAAAPGKGSGKSSTQFASILSLENRFLNCAFLVGLPGLRSRLLPRSSTRYLHLLAELLYTPLLTIPTFCSFNFKPLPNARKRLTNSRSIPFVAICPMPNLSSSSVESIKRWRKKIAPRNSALRCLSSTLSLVILLTLRLS